MAVEILENAIMKAITKMNKEEGNKVIEVYRGHIPQNFNRPCFYLKQLNSSRKDRLGDRHTRKYVYDIHYFPKDLQSPRKELNRMEDLLYYYLYEIELQDSLTRAISMDSEKIDEILHFFVSYRLYLRKEEPGTPKMKTLDFEGGIKHD